MKKTTKIDLFGIKQIADYVGYSYGTILAWKRANPEMPIFQANGIGSPWNSNRKEIDIWIQGKINIPEKIIPAIEKLISDIEEIKIQIEKIKKGEPKKWLSNKNAKAAKKDFPEKAKH